MIAGVLKESYPGERRVALVPAVLPELAKKGIEVLIEPGAGEAAGYPDAGYVEKGAKIAKSREQILNTAGILLQVRTLGTNPEAGLIDLPHLKPGSVVIGLLEPLSAVDQIAALAKKEVTSFGLELIPRITRAQSMDVLSSQASIAGYKAALIAANTVPRMFPMLITAAGTITAARVFVIGAGVAGMQAISTCHRMGAVVQAYDVRPAVKEQVQSVGARFVELELEAGDAEDKGGYAKAMGEDFYKKQSSLMARVVAVSDVVISTAVVPGKKAPVLITSEMAKAMAPGSLIVDLAAEHGGNCALTRPGETVMEGGVMVMGPLNLPSTLPYHASQMYAKNISSFLLHLMRDGAINVNDDDQITRETIVTAGGRVVNARVKEALGLP
jgi:H+-translocating NAD(P) transhydrogenase subunit alpha